MIRWLAAGFGLGLAAGFSASLLHGRRVEPATGYVAPAPAYGQRAVPEVDVRSHPAVEADPATVVPATAGSRSTPVGASVSGGR
jgi:hypothetical protein